MVTESRHRRRSVQANKDPFPLLLQSPATVSVVACSFEVEPLSLQADTCPGLLVILAEHNLLLKSFLLQKAAYHEQHLPR